MNPIFKKTAFAIIVICILFLYVIFPHRYVVEFYDSFMGFTDLGYAKRSAKEWRQKSSNFLYFQIIIPNSSGRKGLALDILSDRKDKRILPILKDFLIKGDSNLNYVAMLCLIKYGKKETIPILMNIVNQYKDMKFYPGDETYWKDYDRYSDALTGLAMLKYEPVYKIALNLAKSDSALEKQLAYNGLLYYYDNHWQEVLSLYEAVLKSQVDVKYFNLGAVKKLGRPEAIPALKEYAKRNPLRKNETEEVIKYLESLKNIKMD